jgi:hypothetical protein
MMMMTEIYVDFGCLCCLCMCECVSVSLFCSKIQDLERQRAEQLAAMTQRYEADKSALEQGT